MRWLVQGKHDAYTGGCWLTCWVCNNQQEAEEYLAIVRANTALGTTYRIMMTDYCFNPKKSPIVRDFSNDPDVFCHGF